MSKQELARDLIAPFLGKRVEATLDGSLFDHVPATFRFRFADPRSLQEELDEGYEDNLEMWDRANLTPVAAVSSAEADAYEFAWVFLDWRDGGEPFVVVTTTDYWRTERGVANLAALELRVV